MKITDFNLVVENRIRKCKNVLMEKNAEYASDIDKLANFKTAAALYHCTPVQALGGMWIKHVVALFDFMRESNKDLAQWEEKITDSINYLLLLEALVEEALEEEGRCMKNI